jgi:hypothetical protein
VGKNVVPSGRVSPISPFHDSRSSWLVDKLKSLPGHEPASEKDLADGILI